MDSKVSNEAMEINLIQEVSLSERFRDAYEFFGLEDKDLIFKYDAKNNVLQVRVKKVLEDELAEYDY